MYAPIPHASHVAFFQVAALCVGGTTQSTTIKCQRSSSKQNNTCQLGTAYPSAEDESGMKAAMS